MQTRSGYWWKEDGPACDAIFDHVRALEQRQAVQRTKDRIHEALYENERLVGGSAPAAFALLRRSMKLNVSRNIVDAVVAKIASKNPAVKVTPDDAEWSLKLKARQLTRFIRGKLRDTDFDTVDDQIVQDALVTGTGCLYVGAEHAEIQPLRVPKEELFVDEDEARYGTPRQLHWRRQYAREVLKELFPEQADKIELAPAAKDPYGYGYESGGDCNMVWVCQSYHLPSAPDADDGRAVIAIEGADLVNEPWDRPRFPFAFLHWAPPRRGFWGKGVVEEVCELQFEIDKVLSKIVEAMDWATLIVAVRRGSNINKGHLGARRPYVLEYDGQEPSWKMPDTFSAQSFQFLEWLVQQAYDICGVSRMSAQARKPAGLQSGKALSEWYDIESERFATFEQRYGLFRVAAAELYIDEAKAIAAEEPGYATAWHERGLVQRIRWKSVDMGRDQFKLALEPASFLPDTRAGKMEAIEQLGKAGIIQNHYLPMLFDTPDLERFNRYRNAPLELIEAHCEQLGDASADMPVPDPVMNLELAQEYIKADLQRAWAEEAPEEVLERYRDYLLQIDAILAPQQQPAGPEMPAGPGGPPMPGGPMPGGDGMLPPAPPPEALGMPGEGMPGAVPGGY